MLADRVVIIFGIAFQADIFSYVVIPDFRVFPVFLCQTLGVVDMSDTGIVRG